MIIKHTQTEKLMENPWNLKVIKFYDSPHGEILHLTLSTGESMLPHIPPVDILLYILAGEPTIKIADEIQKADTGDFIECPKTTPMCVYNEATTDTRLLIIKMPKSTEKPIFLNKEDFFNTKNI